jgi:SAM-dependent methyltransferase
MRERAFYNVVDDELLPQSGSPCRALDIGCGAGQLLVALQRAGWEVEGVEWDRSAAEIARRRSKRTVWAGDFREVDLVPASYHLVVLHHVLEHLDNPLGALRRIRDLLTEGGRAVLIYPNPESLGAKVFREYWFHWDPPRHLVFPPAEAIANAARSIGFDVLNIRTLAKNAGPSFAYSRAYRAGESIDLNQPDFIIKDSALKFSEQSLTYLGSKCGEEIVVVLRRGSSTLNS